MEPMYYISPEVHSKIRQKAAEGGTFCNVCQRFA